MNALNICFVSQEYPDETGWGGIGTYTYEMAHGLARLGHKVVVVSRALQAAQQYVEADGVEVHRVLPSLTVDSAPVIWRLNRWWEGYRLAVAIKLNQIIRERPIDLIESPELHAEPFLFSMLTSKPPIVVRLHSGSRVVANFERDNAKHVSFNSRIESALIRRAAFVTSPSRALRDSLNGELGSRPLAVIPNPVDVDRFSPVAELAHADAPPNVLCVGRPRFIKGIHVLANAIPQVWKEVPEAFFTFVPAPMGNGRGSPNDAYREFLGDLIDDTRVRILDTVLRARLPDIYRAATICVVPSLWEGFGYVAAEAMACGKPVIASRVAGLGEIVVDGKSGVLFETGNANELAHAIVKVIQNRELRSQICSAARHRIISNFASSIIASQMSKLYFDVAS